MIINKFNLAFITTAIIMSSACSYSGAETPDKAMEDLANAFASGNEKDVRNLIIPPKEMYEKITNCPPDMRSKYEAQDNRRLDEAIKDYLGKPMKVVGRNMADDNQSMRKIGGKMGSNGCKALVDHEGLNTRYQIEIDGNVQIFFVSLYKIDKNYRINGIVPL